MKHPSLYLDWYVHVPKMKYDFRSSGLGSFNFNLMLGEVNLTLNYEKGNPETAKLLAQRYHVRPENVFVSSEGASGQNARIIRVLAEKNGRKNEAIVEYPTYEPLLRQVQEHFRTVKRLERDEKEAYRLHADRLRKIVSEKTGLLVLTNPHSPSGAVSDVSELKEIMSVANEYGFYILCDEIYAEFNRDVIPAISSINSEWGIVTTSFSKAYGLGGLKMGVALAKEGIVDELYSDALSTVGTFSNVVELVTSKLLTEGHSALERNRQKWVGLRKEAEKLLNERGFEYFPNDVSITFWVKLPSKDTHKWTNEHAIPRYDWAAVPGAFFLFKNDYKLVKSDRIRLGVGNINPDKPNLTEAFDVLGKALGTYR
jgi:aspartate/methionine/tyrosine aminotransferase